MIKIKNKLFIILWLLSLGFAVQAQDLYVSTSFHEPATDGLRFIYSRDAVHWDSIPGTFLAPKVGKQKVMRDPSIIRTPDGVFHLVWTSSWRGDRGFGYAESRDLMHWSEPKFIEVMDDPTTVNVWAPELFWDEDRQQAMVVWASCVPSQHFALGIEDEKNNHRLYYSVTKDFKTWTKGKLLIDPGFSCIDATLLKRGKNDYVMVLKDNTRNARNIKVAFAKNPMGPWSKASEPFTGNFMEGPTTVKLPKNSPLGNGYLIYYDRYRLFDFGAHFTKDFIHFTDVSQQVSVPKNHKHGTIFRAPERIVKAMLEQDRIHYTGTTMADPSRHDGALSPVVGVHNIQTLRANREHPSQANGGGWTYNHQPMMAYWNGKFYMHFLSDPAEEHVPPSRTLMQVSEDGYNWSQPQILFPEYDVPADFRKAKYQPKPELQYPDVYKQKPLKAIMHQRVGWYVSKGGILLATGNYGVALDRKDDPNDGNGIGRVVREVKKDGSLGPIYFIYYNHGFNEKNTAYPNYKKAFKAVRAACEEILANPRYRMQWVEEADRGEKLIPVNNGYKAYCDYTLPDGRIASLWKHALTSLSLDGGNTYTTTNRALGFVNSNAKIWGQRLSDGTYATIYNPSEYRWPLGISLSGDGLEYKTLNLICGEVPPMRYGGNYKSRGPQYVRGIQEGNGVPKDSDMWVSYSMNKEDIWVAHVPVPVKTVATAHADDDFAQYQKLGDLKTWNIYSPLMAPVSLRQEWLELKDEDPFDYACVERKIPASSYLKASFDVQAAQTRNGSLQIEFLDEKGIACTRIELNKEGMIRVKNGARYGNVMPYQADQTYRFEATLDTQHRQLNLTVSTLGADGKALQSKSTKRIFYAPVHQIERIRFRTGDLRTFPTIDTPADWFGTLEHAGDTDTTALYRIAHVKTVSLDADAGSAVLKTADYKHYVDDFNAMEPEVLHTSAIPNAQAWDWMKQNVPLFDCPQRNFEEMYYFRWWTLRKHIENTPVGYAMTEFLVPRSYADKYNLIASGVGHHIHESRWIRDGKYLDGILNTWYHGNGGKPMAKINFYSSWMPASIWERYLVDGNRKEFKSLLNDLDKEYQQWDDHRWSNGLYWQYDVRDAMEETISGGRKEKNARPSINSYMYGNAMGIAQMAKTIGYQNLARKYEAKADTLKHLVETQLWDGDHQFFEVYKPNAGEAKEVATKRSFQPSGNAAVSAKVREAIGFLPWYFNLPADEAKFAEAWKQAADSKGFSAPYGQTTAERRHPQFRSHGVGKCEWDGAIWPFATAQTLTAMANFINNYQVKPSALAVSSKGSLDMDSLYFNEMEKYVQSQSMRGKPYIGEYLDETTGYWLKGDQERSRYYNHSTFCDLIITGIVGLRPRADQTIEVRPIIPVGKWQYFCLDKVRYHGHDLTILYDQDGSRYHVGKGLQVWVDGKLAGQRDTLGKLVVKDAFK